MTSWHIDTSAVGRLRQPAVARRLAAIGQEDELARCALVDLELLRSAPARLIDEIRRELGALGAAGIAQGDADRALAVQAELTTQGRHGVPAVVLVIAAVAERAGATLLHYDADFDRIAEITGQPVEWVVPRGEAD